MSPDPTAAPSLRLSATVLDGPDPVALAAYYRELLGWEVLLEEPEWVMLAPPGGGAGLSFQLEADHVPPTWPHGPRDQRMQLHLDVAVEVAGGDPVGSLAAAADRAVALGGRLPEHQPQDDVRVVLDPAGHPFCLFLPEG
ncbi:VOC family protein [uncultured Pseudokineococcus sp.]|uniref:VOC family protein n=1 Tax=uncultured Pseudokineococcus sp. TaxID=1642928 RepID=UPI002619EECB|nr:VOC family protein [uncultured Pseudokineococcus sp.]